MWINGEVFLETKEYTKSMVIAKVAAPRARRPGAALSAALGAGRIVQSVARALRAPLLHAEGWGGTGRLRDVPQPGSGARLGAARRRPGRSPRAGHALRAAWALPAHGGGDAACRPGSALRTLPTPEGTARARRLVRPRRQARAAGVSGLHRRAHFPCRRGAARRADNPGAAQ